MSGLVEQRDDQNAEVAKAQVLWSEYQYRHDLIWRVVFQITTAAVVLSVIPYVAKQSLVNDLGRLILLAPGTALGLIVFSAMLIINEMRILGRLRPVYRALQEKLYKQYDSSNFLSERKISERKIFGFPVTLADIFAVSYLVALFGIGAFNFFVVKSL